MTSAPPSLPALTSARFLAAFVVLLHHYTPFLPYPAWLGAIAAHGQAGVCFFFMLSGFILTYNYQPWFAERAPWARCATFYRARFARVYPLHLLTLVAVTPLTLWQVGAFGEAPTASAPYLVATWLVHLGLLQAWAPLPMLHYVWNTASWSISAEFLFYLAFPLVTWLLARRASTAGRLLAVVAVVWSAELAATLAVGVAALGAAPWPGPAGHAGAHWVVATWAALRLGEFVVGCAIGSLLLLDARQPVPLLRPLHDRRTRDLALIGALALALGICGLPAVEGAAGFGLWLLRHHVLFVPCFAVIIGCLALGRTALSPVLERPLALHLGEASYALYLLHGLPVIAFHVVRPTGVLPPLLAIAATLVLASGCHLAIEKPARRWLRATPAPATTDRQAA